MSSDREAERGEASKANGEAVSSEHVSARFTICPDPLDMYTFSQIPNRWRPRSGVVCVSPTEHAEPPICDYCGRWNDLETFPDHYRGRTHQKHSGESARKSGGCSHRNLFPSKFSMNAYEQNIHPRR